MSKLIASAIVLVALAILIFLNVNYTSAINLFGVQLDNVSVVIIAIAGFALGIVYSLLLYIIDRVSKQRKSKLGKTAETAQSTE
jgi:uncharacterized integral membrane protein